MTRTSGLATNRLRFPESTVNDEEPRLSSNFLDSPKGDSLGQIFWSLPPLSFHDKADRLLLAMEKKTQFAGQQVIIADDFLAWAARAWAINKQEIGRLLEYLQIENRITKSVEFGNANKVYFVSPVMILPDGWAHLDELHKQHLDSQQGFIALWFDDSMTEAQGLAFEQGIRDAGYSPQVMNRLEHVGRIDDRIMAEIKRSRFVVADFTGQRGGVYFEAGYALGLGIPVIWTCRKDHMEDLHFDIRQYNCLDWKPDKLDDFKDRLRWRIENVCGRGRAVPLPDGA